jgi:hypothetical protein
MDLRKEEKCFLSVYHVSNSGNFLWGGKEAGMVLEVARRTLKTQTTLTQPICKFPFLLVASNTFLSFCHSFPQPPVGTKMSSPTRASRVERTSLCLTSFLVWSAGTLLQQL